MNREDLKLNSVTTYLFAIACVFAAAVVDFAFAYFVDDITLSIPFYPAVFVVALFGGVGAGLVAVVLAAAFELWAETWYFGDQSGGIQPINVVLYVAAAALIVWVAMRYRNAGQQRPRGQLRIVRTATASNGTVGLGDRLRLAWRDGLKPNSPAAYAFAVAAVAAATLVRFSLGWFGDDILPLACFYPTILIVALVGGLEVGLFAMVLSLLVVGWAFVPPQYSIGLPTRDQVIDCGLFVFASMIAVWLAERYRRPVQQGGREVSAVLEFVAPAIVSFGAVLLTTLVLLSLEPHLGPRQLIAGYLLPTAAIAILYGSSLAILTSFGSGLAAAYFLFPPKSSLLAVDPLNLAAIALFILVALATSKILTLLTYGAAPSIARGPHDDRSLLFRTDSPRSRTGVLLIHDAGGSPFEFRIVASGLAERGYTVYCCQLAGHCLTEGDLLASTWTDWFDSAERALTDLRAQCDIIVIGGLSIGSILALRLAALDPIRVQGLCLFAPTLRYDGWAIPWYSFLLTLGVRAPFLRRMRLPDPPPFGLQDSATRSVIAEAMIAGTSVAASAPSVSLGVLQQSYWLVRDVLRRLASIKVPVLIIHPREDDVSDLSNALYLQRRLGGLVQCLVLDDSYHLITIDRQRSLVMERTANFVDFIEQRAARLRTNSAAARS